ncbi:hypothetical protein [Nocardiopsis flavescens]
MILKSPRSFGYDTWLLLVSSTDTPALQVTLPTGDGGMGLFYIEPGDTYVLPDNGLILGFHVRYANGYSEFYALDHSGPADWHERQAARRHFVWDAVSIGRMIFARTPAGLASAGVGFVLKHTKTGEAVKEAVVSVLPDWTGSPPDHGYYRQSDGSYVLRGAYHL